MSVLPELQRISRVQALKTLKSVRIMHPGSRGSQSIFALPAFPYPRTVGALHGADHRLILDACRILTNYAADEGACYLSKDRAGRHPIPRHSDVLAADKYYYHPGAPATETEVEANYPIVTDFAQWKFPDRIPDHWIRRRSGYGAGDTEEEDRRTCHPWWNMPNKYDMWRGVTANDGGCVVTKYLTSYGVFHLVPRDREDWFQRNRMDRFTLADGDRTGIHDTANGLTLRLDLGDCLERHALVFYPAPEGSGKFLTYLCRWKLDYVEAFHRRLVTISPRVSDEFLYARFAHTVIKLVNTGPGSRLSPFPTLEGVAPSKEECE